MLLTLLRSLTSGTRGAGYVVRRKPANTAGPRIELDWANPLTRQLQLFSVSTALGPYDAVSRQLFRRVDNPGGYETRENGVANGSNSRGGQYELSGWKNSGATTEHTSLVWFRSLAPQSENTVGGNWDPLVGGFRWTYGTGAWRRPELYLRTQTQWTRVISTEDLLGRDLILMSRYSVALNEASLWYDNAKRATTTADGAIGNTSVPMTIMGEPGSSASRLDGYVYQFAVWNRALTDSEILLLLRAPRTFVQSRRFASFAVPGAGGSPGNASGTTLTSTLSLTTGAATGAAAAAGATLTASTSLVAGAATGAASAAGVTLTDTLSFLPGAATAGGAGNAAGVTLVASAEILAGAATGAASAAGVTVTATLSFLAGAASAGVVAPGVTLTATLSFTSGTATGAAAAAGRILPTALTFSPGFATGGGLSSAPGAQITVTASLITGTAETFATPQNSSRIRIGTPTLRDTARIGSSVLRTSKRPIRH